MFAARRLLAARPLARVATRQFHATPRRSAVGKVGSLRRYISDDHVHEYIRELARHPRVLAAAAKVGEGIKRNNFTSFQRPQKTQVVKLLADPEFREAAQKLAEEMERAGIEQRPELFQHLLGLGKRPKDEEPEEEY
ncbi:hypothetical protein FSARC_3280 [Fusarium sarcochroum]|uniref:Uncharacterized protein n=1 Tax=Fusarium sarcochroum TaxID=1208366 RepID=A0A8H4U4K9_9HYPO|nr:hypothetical protein FSARC_3280 [Fusarium sarcochroum]